MPAASRHIVIALCLLSTLSCSSDDGSPTGTGDRGGDGTVTRTIPPDGGVITATSNGTTVTLEFPAGATRVQTEITLRPTGATEGSTFGMLLEPAGMVFYAPIEVRVVLPEGTNLADTYLILGDLSDPWYFPTEIDPVSRALSTQLEFFGITGDPPNRPAYTSGLVASAPNQLGTQTVDCQAIIATLETRFDFYVSQGDFEEAVQLAKTIGAVLNQANCLAQVRDWVAIAENTACDGLAAALGDALSTPTDALGKFYQQVMPLLEFEAILQELNIASACPSLTDIEGVINAEVADYITFFNQLAGGIGAGDWGGFLDVKGEAISAYNLMGAASALGAHDAAFDLEIKALYPAMDILREEAYNHCISDGWHYPLSRLTSTGFFAPRDMAGVAPMFVNPPASQIANFTDDDIWNDLQYCGTDMLVTSVVASQQDFSSERVGTHGSPGQWDDEINLATPTRGKLRLERKLNAFTCWNDVQGDDEIALRIDAKDVFVFPRGTANDYLAGNPIEINIDELAQKAGIQPTEGSPQFITVMRRRSQCEPAVWGPQEYILFDGFLEWKNPTAQVEIQMPTNVNPGETVDVDVRVKVIDQLGEAGFFDAIDVVLRAAGGTLKVASGQTDSQGYFRTQITADTRQSVTGAGGPVIQGIQVDATATTFEGVTAQGSASATLGTLGTTQLTWVSQTGNVRIFGLGEVNDDNGDYINPPNPGGWTWNGSVQADSTAPDNRFYSASASTDVTTTLVVAGDVVNSFSGSISGSSQLTTTGEFTPSSQWPSAVQDAELWIRFEVIGGNVPYTLTANTNVSGEYNTWVELSGDQFIAGYDGDTKPPPATVNASGVLTPGQYDFEIYGQTVNRCTNCSTSGTVSIDFSLTLGTN